MDRSMKVHLENQSYKTVVLTLWHKLTHTHPGESFCFVFKLTSFVNLPLVAVSVYVPFWYNLSTIDNNGSIGTDLAYNVHQAYIVGGTPHLHTHSCCMHSNLIHLTWNQSNIILIDHFRFKFSDSIEWHLTEYERFEYDGSIHCHQ